MLIVRILLVRSAVHAIFVGNPAIPIQVGVVDNRIISEKYISRVSDETK